MWLVHVKYCDLLDLVRAQWLGTGKKFVPARVKLREDQWGRRRQGWSAPTEIHRKRRLIDISSVSTSDVWVWVAKIDTVIDFAHLVDGRSRLKTEVYEVYEVVRAQLHAFGRLQSLD